MKFLIFLHETLALTAMLLVMFRTGAVNKISIQVARKIKLPIRHFRTEKKTGASWLSQRLLGLLLWTGKKNSQQLTGASPLTIPETIARQLRSGEL